MSLKETIDPKFTARARFWLAETDYNLSNYDDALIAFKQFEGIAGAKQTPEFTNINYNLGHTYFKLKNYNKSSDYFTKYVTENPTDTNRINDAHLRLGDGYFVSSDFNKAIVSYDEAIKVGALEKDYAVFQKALSYGSLGNQTKKHFVGDNKLSDYSVKELQYGGVQRGFQPFNGFERFADYLWR